VARGFQNRGIGGRLLARAFAVARNRLVHSVHMVFLPKNDQIRYLLRGRGATVARGAIPAQFGGWQRTS
jgi:ribosomal protein S18 acetylase RimI-like enzyme